MFDIHYHLIYGVDDGPKSLEASLELAEASIAEGVTHIVSTPHASYRYPYQRKTNEERLAILSDRLSGRLTLGLGCDFHLSFDNVVELESDPRRFTINRSKYLLVEFPDLIVSHICGQLLFRISSLGLTPIITHPERNPTLLRSPERMLEWLSMGCLVQLTAASLVGRFGSRAQDFSNSLLRENQVHLIASDAHGVTGRPPAMRTAFAALEKEYGVETAQRLCIGNPRAVFLGEELPPQPAPEETVAPPFTRKGLLRRLFR